MRRWMAAGAGLLLCAAGLRAQTVALRRPVGIAYDAQGNLFIADSARNQVLESTVGGALVVVAGTGVQGFGGDGAAATSALLNAPCGVAVASDGTLYIADTGNNRVRAVDASGVIRTAVGSGVRGFGGDGGDATLAELNAPSAVAVNAAGVLFVADTANERVRAVTAGVITTFAGTGRQGFGGDGGAATAAMLDSPEGVAATSDGRVVIADTHNQRVRVVAADGTIATVAGIGVAGFSGDGGAAVTAKLFLPRAVAVTGDGSLVIADSGNARVRVVSAAGVISTVAGTGVQGSAADGAVASGATLNEPRGVAVSPFGLVVFADAAAHTVTGVAGGGLFAAAGLTVRSSAVQWTPPASAAYGAGAVTVNVAGSVGTPQGVVELRDGGVRVASGTLVGGSLSFGLDGLNAAQHALSVAYAGDGFNPAAVSGVASLTVTPATVTAAANAAGAVYGAVLPALTGTLNGVLARDAGNVTATFSSGASGLAAVGSYPISATLSGPASGNYVLASANAGASLTVTQARSTVVLQTPGTGYAGLPLMLSATVSPEFAGQPGGQVVFFDGATQVATAQVVNGSASGVYLAPGSGTHSLTAQYAGDANFLPGTSAAQVATVGAMPDFSIAVQGASSQSAVVGTTATYTLVVAGTGAFSGAVTMSASGLPTTTQVAFSPGAVVPGAGSATVVMSVPTALLLAQRRDERWGVFLAFAPLLWLVRRRRRWLPAVAAVLLVSATGCGTRTVGDSTTNSKSYTITVTGTGTNLAGAVVTHSTTVQLTVE